MPTIFVFGSNEAGRHGKGAALHAAKKHGAQRNVGEGPTGNAYALPTKDYQLRPRKLTAIAASADRFIGYALRHPSKRFYLTRVGCGLAGFKEWQIAPLFWLAPRNVVLPEGWAKLSEGDPYTKPPTNAKGKNT